MTAIGAINAGGRILASAMRDIAPLAVIKGADESVTSSTTLQNDDALLVTLTASASYLFLCYLNFEGGTEGSSDIKWTWTGPSGYTLRYHAIHEGTGGSSNVTQTATGSTTVTSGTKTAAVLCGATMVGSLIMSSTPGVLQLQWAQNTSSGTATIVHANSFLALWRVS